MGAADTAGRRASLSPSDAATELGLSESVVRKLVNSGELGHRRVGSRILIGQEHIAVSVSYTHLDVYKRQA